MGEKIARLCLWCSHCERYVVMRQDQFDESPVCPSCHKPFEDMRCSRCGHKWTPRKPITESMPGTCPSKTCKSPYWNRERMRRDDSGTQS